MPELQLFLRSRIWLFGWIFHWSSCVFAAHYIVSSGPFKKLMIHPVTILPQRRKESVSSFDICVSFQEIFEWFLSSQFLQAVITSVCLSDSSSQSMKLNFAFVLIKEMTLCSVITSVCLKLNNCCSAETNKYIKF